MPALSPLVRSFVSHFGEMGSRWGINRTVGQIYALIFVSPQPLNADDIAEALEFSRSNVSMGLKELQAWRLVNLRHLPGDRREYFDAPTDAWDIFRTLAEESAWWEESLQRARPVHAELAEAALDALTAALGDRSSRVRGTAAWAIGQLADDDQVDAGQDLRPER